LNFLYRFIPANTLRFSHYKRFAALHKLKEPIGIGMVGDVLRVLSLGGGVVTVKGAAAMLYSPMMDSVPFMLQALTRGSQLTLPVPAVCLVAHSPANQLP
jgi:hypothetical protein